MVRDIINSLVRNIEVAFDFDLSKQDMIMV